MVAVTPELTDLLADGTNVVRLSQELFGGEAQLISKSNNREMANLSVPADVRAAKLVGMVMTKVDLNSQNFYKFVKALKKDEVTYETILAKLCKICNINRLYMYIHCSCVRLDLLLHFPYIYHDKLCNIVDTHNYGPSDHCQVSCNYQ